MKPQDFSEVALTVSDCVAVINQILDYTVPIVTVEGELTNFRVSRGKWVYFDIKDDTASLKCFAVAYSLRSQLEDGMMVRVTGSPRLHPLYNFSLNVQQVTPVGEGALRRAADLLRLQLEAEGLFDPVRKRPLPPIPVHIALITAADSAAYSDFIKIVRARWGGVQIDHYDTPVQGETAADMIVRAIATANASPDLPEIIVLTRGGGSAEDLAVFNDERVVRAIAASRVPTLVAIGHERDMSLAEEAADVRASTPSNAAELLLPDRQGERQHLAALRNSLNVSLKGVVAHRRQQLDGLRETLGAYLIRTAESARQMVTSKSALLTALDPLRPLEQGYALVRGADGALIRTAIGLGPFDILEIELRDGYVSAETKKVRMKGKGKSHDQK